MDSEITSQASLTVALNTPQEVADAAAKFLYFLSLIANSSPHTLRAYVSDLKQAFGLAELSAKSGRPSRIDEMALMALCRQAMLRWSTLSPSSRNRKGATLKSFLGWLYEQEAIGRDLALQVHTPKIPERLPHHLSPDEAIALIHSLKARVENAGSRDLPEAKRDLALVLLLYGGGLRVSEACNLEWGQVSGTTARSLRVKGKGGKERFVALPPMAAHALLALKEFDFHPTLVFGEFSTRKAYDVVRSAGARAGLLQPLHPHALRHSFATHLLVSGANLRTLQELLGHQTLQATQRYTHLSLDQLEQTLSSFHPLSQGLTDDAPSKPTKPKAK